MLRLLGNLIIKIRLRIIIKILGSRNQKKIYLKRNIDFIALIFINFFFFIILNFLFFVFFFKNRLKNFLKLIKKAHI